FISSDKKEIEDDSLKFSTKPEAIDYLQSHPHVIPKMHTADQNNTSITYDNRLFLKMYRKVEKTINPDIEINTFLSEEASFPHVPKFMGSIELKSEDSFSLGMMQEMIENHGNGQSYMLERINNFIERILARSNEKPDPFDRRGNFTDPVEIDDLPESLQILLGSRVAEQVRLIGQRTAEMHLTLANSNAPDFKPEEYSLHYQRSLFSSMQALAREAYQCMNKNDESLPDDVKKELEAIKGKKNDLLSMARKIYEKKLDIWKSRTHGSYTLKKLLMTGKDVVIQDFSGNPNRSFSARRIKRSPLRDIAEMIISFHYTAYEGFFLNNHLQKDQLPHFLPYAEQWAHYMSGFFLKAYLDSVQNSRMIPKDRADLEVVLHTFLLEKSLGHFNNELNHRPEWSIVPLKIIKSVLGIEERV
ncbi:MAG: maltose alpha-D-glucosyltransferase, partial [Flavisolibacter sp.]